MKREQERRLKQKADEYAAGKDEREIRRLLDKAQEEDAEEKKTDES